MVRSPVTSRLRVLVIDDNHDAADTLAMLLATAGYVVLKKYDGQTAVTAAIEFKPHIVLLDLGMPGMSGLTVAKAIRQNPALDNIVLVATTGYDREEDMRNAREAGINHYLVKPTSFDDVQKLLASVAEKAC